MFPVPPLYRAKKGAVTFLPKNPKKPQPLDLHRAIEHGGHKFAYGIYYSVADAKASRTCIRQVKRQSQVGTHPKRANPPTFCQNSTLKSGSKSGILRDYCGRGKI